MVTLVTILYVSLVYMVFFKFEWLPWNRFTRLISLIIGVVILLGFIVGLDNLTPSSSQAVVMGRVVDIAPQVAGVVLSVSVKPNERVDKGSVLFEIDPTLFAAQVKELEATVALQRLRLGQFVELAEVEAASEFQIEQTEAQIEQLEARLQAARFNLENCTVRAPFVGRVPKLLLRSGVQVSPARSVLSFVDTKRLAIFAIFDQKALQNVRVGDRAIVNFPALPGRLYETEVRTLVSGIQEGQILATGQLESVLRRRMVRSYPVILNLPEDFPPELRKVGLAANATILTEGAGPVALVAIITQWIAASLDAVL